MLLNRQLDNEKSKQGSVIVDVGGSQKIMSKVSLVSLTKQWQDQ
jgi:hypothetical protein